MNNKIIKWKTRWKDQLPEPYRGSGPEEWPKFSIVSRLPEIGRRLIAENAYENSIEDKIHTLLAEIPEQTISMLDDPYGADLHQWNSLISRNFGLNWLEVPWFFTEFYFYRRLLQATEYFLESEKDRLDPFQYQKTEGLFRSLKLTERILGADQKSKRLDVQKSERLKHFLELMLKGNQIDLSLWPVNENDAADMMFEDVQTGQFIVNQLDFFIQWVLEKSDRKVNLLIDNAGFELLSDLLFVEFLLTEGISSKVVLHVKPYPIFVSDALENDVTYILDQLDDKSIYFPHLSEVSLNLQRAMEDGSLVITSDLFWGMPVALWDMPDHLYAEFSQSDLVISKGDANYRRLVGDRRWDHSISFESVVSYLPCSVLALRIIKSDAGVGYPQEKMDEIMQLDPDWMKNGKWGCVQFWEKSER